MPTGHGTCGYEGRLRRSPPSKNATADAIFKTAYADGRREPREAYLFDALHQLICNDAAALPVGTSLRKSSGPAYLALVRADISALKRGRVEGDEVCDMPGVGPLSVPALREILPDAIIKLVISDGVDVANVTHLGRKPTVAQQVALLWQTPECIVGGCNRTDIEFEHHDDWRAVRRTELANLGGLCHHHHDLKSRGWRLIREPDRSARLEPPP